MIEKIKMIFIFALRDVSRNRIVLFLIMFSLTSIFTASMLSLGILEGFQSTLQDGSINTGGHLTVKSEKEGGHIENVDSVIATIKSLENVAGYSVRSYGGLIIKKGAIHESVSYAAIGVDPESEKATSQIPKGIIEGRYLLPDDQGKVVVGVTLADALSGIMYDGESVKVGEKVVFFSPVTARSFEYTIIGIVDAKYFHPNWSSYLPKRELEWLDDSRQNGEIIIRLKNPSNLEESKKYLQEALPKCVVFSWSEKEGYVFNIITAVRFITDNVSILLLIMIFVILNVFIYINVLQRRRNIGILKSMGVGNNFIGLVYIAEVLIYFSVPFILSCLGLFLVYLFFFYYPVSLLIGDFKVVLRFKDIFKGFLIILVVSILGSIFPTYLAFKTCIVDILHEKK